MKRLLSRLLPSKKAKMHQEDSTRHPSFKNNKNGVDAGTINQLSAMLQRDESKTQLRRLFEDDPELEELDFTFEDGLGNYGTAMLVDLLSKDRNIKKLYLSGCSIDAIAVEAMVRELNDNESIEELYLDGNNIGRTGAIYIGEMLRIRQHPLKKLSLCFCSIEMSDIKQILRGLEQNHMNSLEDLRLGGNDVKDEGAKIIGNMLKSPNQVRNLKRLDLSGCHIGKEGLKYLMDGVESNDTITELSLWGNDFRHKSTEEENSIFRNLRLNKAGRCFFRRENVDNSTWVNVFSDASQLGGVDALYYFVRRKPDLFTISDSSPDNLPVQENNERSRLIASDEDDQTKPSDMHISNTNSTKKYQLLFQQENDADSEPIIKQICDRRGKGVSSPFAEEDPATLIKRAEELRQLGIKIGVMGGNVEAAATAFRNAKELLCKFDTGHNSNDGCMPVYVAGLVLLATVLLDFAELFLLERKHDSARSVLLEALDVQKKLCTGDSGIDDIKIKLILIKIYRALSVADYYLSGDFQEWDKRAIALLDDLGVPSTVESSARFTFLEEADAELVYLRAIFLSYKAIDEEDLSTAIQMNTNATNLLEEVVAKHPNDNRFARRLAEVSRRASYKLREGNKIQESYDGLQRAIKISKKLVDETPMSPTYIGDLFHAYDALADHLKATSKKDDKLLVALRDAEAALTQLVKLLPSVSYHWNNLTNARIDLAKRLENSGDKSGALVKLEQAIDSSEHSISLAEEVEPDAIYDQCRALFEIGRVASSLKNYTKAMLYYNRGRKKYASLLDFDKGGKEFYRKEFARAMGAAHDAAVEAEQEDQAFDFIKSAIEVGQTLKRRENRQLYFCHLNDLGNLYLKGTMYEDARRVFSQCLGMARSLFEEFPWHFYLGQSYSGAHLGLAKVCQATGSLKHEMHHRCEYLKYHADLHGIGISNWMSNIYSGGKDAMERLRAKCIDTPKFFKIVIVTYFPGAKEHSPFSFYLCSSIPGVDPLAAQARSLEEDHGGVVGEDVRTSVRRLQELALDNNVDFVELARYAINGALREQQQAPAD